MKNAKIHKTRLQTSLFLLSRFFAFFFSRIFAFSILYLIFLNAKKTRKEEREKARKGGKENKVKEIKKEYEIGVSRLFAFFFSRISRSLSFDKGWVYCQNLSFLYILGLRKFYRLRKTDNFQT
jgi:hypothetical protein